MVDKATKTDEFRAIPLWLLERWKPDRGRASVSDAVVLVYMLLCREGEPVYNNGKCNGVYRVNTCAPDIAKHLHFTCRVAQGALRMLERMELAKSEYVPGRRGQHVITVYTAVARSGNREVVTETATLGRGEVVSEGVEVVTEPVTETATLSGVEVVTDAGTHVSPDRRIRSKQGETDPDQRGEISLEGFRSFDPKEFAAKHWKAINAMRFNFRRLFPHSKYEKHTRGTGNISNECLDKLHLELIGKGGTDQEIFRTMQTYRLSTEKSDILGVASPLAVYASLQSLLNREKRWLRQWEQRGEGCADEIKRLYREAMMVHFQNPPQEGQGEVEDNGQNPPPSLCLPIEAKQESNGNGNS